MYTHTHAHIYITSSYKVYTAYNLLVTINLKEMILPSVGFEPGSILAFQDLHTTNVATSRWPKKPGHLVKSAREAIYSMYCSGRWPFQGSFSSLHVRWIWADKMTGCVGSTVKSTKNLGLQAK